MGGNPPISPPLMAMSVSTPTFTIDEDFYCGATIEHASGNLAKVTRTVELLSP
jgi:hypothetical protein